jgi:hypothetical protein
VEVFMLFHTDPPRGYVPASWFHEPAVLATLGTVGLLGLLTALFVWFRASLARRDGRTEPATPSPGSAPGEERRT